MPLQWGVRTPAAALLRGGTTLSERDSPERKATGTYLPHSDPSSETDEQTSVPDLLKGDWFPALGQVTLQLVVGFHLLYRDFEYLEFPHAARLPRRRWSPYYAGHRLFSPSRCGGGIGRHAGLSPRKLRVQVPSASLAVLWCNGSTPGSQPGSRGSTPRRTTEMDRGRDCRVVRQSLLSRPAPKFRGPVLRHQGRDKPAPGRARRPRRHAARPRQHRIGQTANPGATRRFVSRGARR